MQETFIPEIADPQARAALAEAVVALLARWGVAPPGQRALLGGPDASGLLAGEPVPDDPDVLERVGHLLAVERELRALRRDFPSAADDWITTAQPELGGRTPLEVMRSEHVTGMKRVRRVLEAQSRRARTAARRMAGG